MVAKVTHSRPPNPLPGLEASIVNLLQELVRGTLAGKAELLISRMPGHPEWTEPYFELRPSNPRSARIAGIVVNGDGIDMTIGSAAVLDLRAEGSSLSKDLPCEEEFRLICNAVIRGGFTEVLYMNSRGETVYSEGKLCINGVEKLVADHGRWFWLPFIRRLKRIVNYDPYGSEFNR
jgi:hypothetical protein